MPGQNYATNLKRLESYEILQYLLRQNGSSEHFFPKLLVVCCNYPIIAVDAANMQMGRLSQDLGKYSITCQIRKSQD